MIHAMQNIMFITKQELYLLRAVQLWKVTYPEPSQPPCHPCPHPSTGNPPLPYKVFCAQPS